MKNKISKLLEQTKRALSFEEICKNINCNNTSDVKNALDELLQKYDVYKTTNGKFLTINSSPYRKGKYVATKGGNGKVVTSNQEYVISKENSNEAVDGDIVLIEPIFTKNKRTNEGNILLVLERDLDTVIGEVYNVDKKAMLKTDNFKLKKLNIRIENPKNLVDGEKVIVKLKARDGINEYFGTVIKDIGYKNDPGVDIEAVAFRYNFLKDFNEDTIEELKNIPDFVMSNELKGRLDLRHIQIFTIDGKDTKDIDDAISLAKMSNGHYFVGVHIADVTHYVKDGSAIDKEAYSRATSGYFASTVIPMLPQQLSNGICSLNPNVDRLTISVFAEIDTTGKIVDSFVTPSVINSKKQMNYDDVNDVLSGKNVPGYGKFTPILLEMNKFSKTQIKRRDNKGALSLDDYELNVILDDNGYPVDFKVKHNFDAENIIESFMLIANQVAPMKLTTIEAPCIYRVHEKPNIDSLNKYLRLYKVMGYEYNKELDNSCLVVQSILKDTEDKEEKRVLQLYLLRALMKAVYSAQNKGHSGLAMEEYSQFTSPIRRYPDDILHRLLKEFVMCGEKYEKEVKKFDEKIEECYPNIIRYDGPIKEEPNVEAKNEWQLKLPRMADHTSQREQQEVACERYVMRMKTAEFMKNHIGEEYEGTVTGITEKGMFVELDNLINGMIPISALPGHFTYNENLFELENKKDGKKYHVGDRLLVSVMNANKERAMIDFHLVKPIKQVKARDIYQDAVQKIKTKKVTSHNKRPFNKTKHK